MTTEEFRKLSALAALLIPHDGAGLTLRSPDRLLRGQLLAAGYRSFLAVHTSTAFQPLSLSFWSKQPNVEEGDAGGGD